MASGGVSAPTRGEDLAQDLEHALVRLGVPDRDAERPRTQRASHECGVAQVEPPLTALPHDGRGLGMCGAQVAKKEVGNPRNDPEPGTFT